MAPRPTYTTPIEQCDVQDKAALATYRDKRAEWLDWLNGDDDHSISHQLLGMSWSYITFRVISEAARLAHRRELRSPIRNSVLFEHLTDGFVATQALAIRRLLDKRRDVVSLRRLVDDVGSNRSLFVREFFVAYDGAPSDFTPQRDAFHEQLMRDTIKNGPTARWAPNPSSGPDAWAFSERAHEAFDRLTNAGPSRRQRTDSVPDLIFDRLACFLDADVFEKIRRLANKRIAHAADEKSRGAGGRDVDGVSFREIDEAHRHLIMVGNFVSSFLLYQTNLAPVATPSFDVFEHIDAAGFDDEAIAHLHRLASALASRRDQWARGATAAVLGAAAADPA